MKKVIFAAVLSAFALVSCNKEYETPDTGGPEPTTPVTITFNSDEILTRASDGDGAESLPWEKKIVRMCIYVYDSNGDWAETRELTTEEIGAGKLNYAVPSRLCESDATFYVVANKYRMNIATAAIMEQQKDDYPTIYNWAGDDHTQAKCYNDGFVMSARKKVAIPMYGEPLSLHFNLKRTVAKIALRISIDPKFGQRYPGHKLEMTGCGVYYTNKAAMLFEPSAGEPVDLTIYSTVSRAYPADLTAGETDDKIFYFYVYPNGALPTNPPIKPCAVFGGDLTTPQGMRSRVDYYIPINEANNHEIARNGFYKLNVAVTGISGCDVEATFETASWGSENSFTEDIGY